MRNTAKVCNFSFSSDISELCSTFIWYLEKCMGEEKMKDGVK